MKSIAVSMDEPSLAALDGLAAHRTSRSELIRQAVAEFLARRARLAAEAREALILEVHAGNLAGEARALLEDQDEP